MSLINAAELYFSKMNSISARMYADFEETKNSYECVWKTLSHDEQCQILNECIIKPEVTLKYSLKCNAVMDNVFNSQSFAQKRVVDEHISYRDEHSAPFSFKTASQVDLRLFGNNSIKKTILSPKIDAPKSQKVKIETSPINSTPVMYKTETCGLLEKLLRRRSSPVAEQEVLVSPQSTSDSFDSSEVISSATSTSILPKTGLDFLDNW